MRIESRGECWALSSKFPEGRLFLGIFCWEEFAALDIMGVALFETRKEARKARKTCQYSKARVEKVRVTVEVIK